jgi:membrane protein required for colicin V production
MNALDMGVIAALVVSALVGLVRGFTREVLSLAAWVAAFLLAKTLAPVLAPAIPGIDNPSLRHLAALALVFVVTLVAASLLAMAISRMVKWAGLGFYDKLVGLLFGALRGGLIVLIFALAAGLTALPETRFWRSSLTHGQLEAMADAAKPWLPAELAAHVKFKR